MQQTIRLDRQGPRQMCAACGTTRDSFLCPMSDDGEGPHDWIITEPTPDPATLRELERIANHLAQGAQER